MDGRQSFVRIRSPDFEWARGLAFLIPEGIAQGLIGRPYIRANMVGGGDLASFASGASLDQEHFVRYAQCAALFPMLQFSPSPARVLDERHLAAVMVAVELRQSLLPELMQLVDLASTTMVPIVRPIAYQYPSFERVVDQFLLGDYILVAPVLERGATS